jgi:propionyl-CoA synthetase
MNARTRIDLWPTARRIAAKWVAVFRLAITVARLPKTGSGKILRGTMKKIADHDPWTVPATIDDPAILDEIGAALREHGVVAR